ncbi:MAG: MarR family transcriptional regulator [Acidobacteria bacterium]|nr:MarR family transcriptional regulator [Acidobacteriota bacterium]
MTGTTTSKAALAREAFDVMSSLVLDNDRRREVTETVGLSFGRLRTLRRIVDHPLAMGDLAAQINVDPPNLTAMVDDLEHLGLVERCAHPSDRRIKMIATTSKGAALARQAQVILDRPPAGLATLCAEDLRTLVRILASVRDGS